MAENQSKSWNEIDNWNDCGAEKSNMASRRVSAIMRNQKKRTGEKEKCKQIVETEKTKETRKSSSEQESQGLNNNIQEITPSFHVSEKERPLQQEHATTETTSLQLKLKKQDREKGSMLEDMTKLPYSYTNETKLHSNKVNQLETFKEVEQEESEYEKHIEDYDEEIHKILINQRMTEQQLLDKVSELTGKLNDAMKEKSELREKLRRSEETALEVDCVNQIHKERIQKLEQLVEQKEKEKNETQHKSESIILKLVKENKNMDDNLTNIQAHMRQKRIESERTNEEIQRIAEEREKIAEHIKEFTNHLQTLKQERQLMDIVMQVSIAAFGDRFQMKDRQIRQLQETIDNDRKQFTEERKSYTEKIEELKALLAEQNQRNA